MEKSKIAIVGIGCHAPGNINSPDSFWSQLINGVNGVTEVPKDRWNIEEYYDPNPNKSGKIKNNKGGFIKEIDKFDNEFFRIFPKEAERIDPQQRLLLQTTFESMEDAGDKLAQLRNTDTAVFMSTFTNDYWDIQVSQESRYDISPHTPMGSSLTAIANRISYFYNLKGPSVSIDTACSGSLVAVHLACQSIWSGDAEAAFAGGANLIINPESTIMMSKGNFLSPDGYCKAFDEKANGYVRSEGIGVVYLKKLDEALRDNNKIYGIIKATVCNSDGHTSEGFTVPSESSQTKMLKDAYLQAGIHPDQLQYIEAHGTGTPIGDPIETKSFSNVFATDKRKNPVMIGSVKSNIGHLEGAAGVAGLIKLALSMKHKKIPGNLHFNKVNPKIDLEGWKLKVINENTDWPEQPDASPRIGGVNSFGAGGTNAHLVLEEYIPNDRELNKPVKENLYLFHTSAMTQEALKTLLLEYKSYINESEHHLRDICYNTGKHRSDLRYRIAIAGNDKKDIIHKIDAYLEGNVLAGVEVNEVDSPPKKLSFIFTGQGPQWYAMGQELIAKEPLFRSIIQEIEGHFKQIAGWSLLEEMNKDEENTNVNDTRIAQPAIMAIQIALVELWKKHGVEPQGVIGHSIGEVAAAYTAGALTLEQAVQVIFHRSRGQHAATGKGKMLAVSVSLDEARELIKNVDNVVSIGAVNGPNMVVLSGDEEPLADISAELEAKDIFNKFLRVTVPFHSHHMEPLKDELIGSLEGLIPDNAKIDLYSTVTGRKEDGSHLVSEYWYDNVREPVYFANALKEMLNDGYDLFIEIGPHPALSVGAEELFEKQNVRANIFPSIKRKEPEKLRFLQTLGAMYTLGFDLSWESIYPESNHLFDLPRYTWDRKSFWFEPKVHRERRLEKKSHPLVIGYDRSGLHDTSYNFNVLLDRRTDPYIEDHKVNDGIIFPATGHLEIATAAAKHAFGKDFGFLEDVNFESALFLPEDGERYEVKLEVYSDEESYWILSRDTNNPDAEWVKHSNGKMNTLGDTFTSRSVDLDEIKERVNDRLPVQPMYLELKKGGLQYGATFRAIKNLWVVMDEILSKIEVHESLKYGINDYYLHPCILDACLHTIFAAKMSTEDEERGIYLPIHIDRYKFHNKPKSETVYSYVKVAEASSDYLKGDFWIIDEDGNTVAEIQGLNCKYIKGSRASDEDMAYTGTYEYQWVESEEMTYKPANSEILVLEEKGANFSALDEKLQELGSSVVRADIPDYSDREEVRQVLQKVVKKHEILKNVVINLPLQYTDESKVADETQELSWKLLNVFNAIIELEIQSTIWVVNEQADLLTPQDSEVNMMASVTYGLSRVTVNEFPIAKIKLVDLGDRTSKSEIHSLAQLISSTSNGGDESDFALRNEKIYVKRLVSVTRESAQEEASISLPASGSYYQTILKEEGILDSIGFRQIVPFEIGDKEVEIDVKAAGLNFKDVLNLNGLLSEESVFGGLVGSQLGLESSGIVSRVGKAVKHVQKGDRVLAFSPNSFAGKVVTPSHCVAKLPDHISFEEAATITLVYLTAYHCLLNLGQMEQGESVLIHSATGGVGLAAIAIAKHYGAEIYATAGTKDKRDFLRELGVKHTYDSRSLSFYDEVMKDTSGKGVDLVLNSLSGKAIIQSIKCLKPFGRFLEIGKADIYEDMSLQLKRFGDNLSYFAVDIDRLMAQRPDKATRLLQNVMDLFYENKVQPHPYTSFKINDIGDAIDHLSKGKHIGKVVLSMEDQEVKALSPEKLRFSSEGSYIITGGASGLGIELAKWMVNNGAKHLALVSRSGPKSAYDKGWIEQMHKHGANIMIEKLDLSSEKEVNDMVKRVNKIAPLAGIIHGAAVLEDATIQRMSRELFSKVFKPKAIGAWNLHNATDQMDLDFFLSLSSISAVFGLPGQANYSAANNFLDKLVAFRKSKGLHAQSVNLGVLGQFAGMSKEGGNVLNVLENQGWMPMTINQVTSKIERILLEGDRVRMAANIDWGRFGEFFSHLKNDARFRHLLTDKSLSANTSRAGAESLKDKLLAANGEGKGMLTLNLKEALARILGTTPDKLDENKSISAIGLDSLMMNQLRNWILQKLEFNYPLMRLSKGPSIKEIAEHIMESFLSSASNEKSNHDESGISTEEDIEVINNWFVHRKAENDVSGKLKLFMFHSMGAGASMFNDFMYEAPKGTDVYAVQLPGRENRKDEKLYTDFQKLLDDLEAAILPLLDGDFAIYGHSFGGIIAFELTRRLRKNHGKRPVHFWSSATMAPQMTVTWKNRDVLKQSAISSNSEQKLIGLMTYIDDLEYVKKILPILRLDMALLMDYDYEDDHKFEFPITVFSAIEDEVTLPEEMEPWKNLTASEFRQELVHGDHWFVSRNKDFIREQISQDLERILLDHM